MSEFFDNVRAINLEGHLISKCGAKILQSGKTTHVNPCPLCDHRDCFTLYRDTNSFKCFSCDRAGDIINFERHRLNLDSNKAAAYALADQYGIPSSGTGEKYFAPSSPESESVGKSSAPTPPPTEPVQPEPAAPPLIDRHRANALRALATDYFHDLLMRNPDALKYQTGHRGHSLDTLRAYRIGWSNGNTNQFLAHMQAAGFTTDETKACGITGTTKAGKPWLKFKPNRFIYPCAINGDTGHFTFKDPNPIKKDREKWQLKRESADPDYLCYNQDALAAQKFVLVEGEDDALTCLEHGLKHVAAVIGNMNTTRLTEWLEKNATGKTVYLAFDPDDAGAKYYKKYREALHKAGAAVYSLESALIAAGDDIDAVVRRADDPDAFLSGLITNATPCAPPSKPGRGGKSSAPTPPTLPSIVPSAASQKKSIIEHYGFTGFEILGETESGKIVMWSVEKKKVYDCTLKELTYMQLIQTGGDEIRERVTRKAEEGKILFASLQADIILEAGRTPLSGVSKLGIGIHQLKDKRLLLVSGAEAWIWDGRSLTQQEFPIIDHKMLSFDPSKPWVNVPALREELAKMDRARASAIYAKFAAQIAQWGFAGDQDILIVSGWILAQVVQAAWVWRPHLWVTGSAGSGKSLLTQFVSAVFGPLVHLTLGQSTTEAALRQRMNETSHMTIVDEFENSKDRDRIIEFLRSAGYGGAADKGSVEGKPISYPIRHMVMLGSVETKIDRAAEKHRYIVVNTKKDESKRPTIPAGEIAAAMNTCMIAYALWAVYQAVQLVEDHGPLEGEDNRYIGTLSVPLAMAAVSTPSPLESLRENILIYLDADRAGGAKAPDDERGLLEDILQSRIRIMEMTGYSEHSDGKITYPERTIGLMLTTIPMTEETDKTLQAHGIRLCNAGLFIRPETVSTMLATTAPKWKGLTIKDMLLRLPGAHRKVARLGGIPLQGVMIPMETWCVDDEDVEE